MRARHWMVTLALLTAAAQSLSGLSLASEPLCDVTSGLISPLPSHQLTAGAHQPAGGVQAWGLTAPTLTPAPEDIVLSGEVYDALRGPAHVVSGAAVSLCLSVPRCFTTAAGPDGHYHLVVPALYAHLVQFLQASAPGYYTLTELVTAAELLAQPQRPLALIPWLYHACLPVAAGRSLFAPLTPPMATLVTTPTPTSTAEATATQSLPPTEAPTLTGTMTPSPTATDTTHPSETATPTATAEETAAPSPVATATFTETATPVASETPLTHPTETEGPTDTATPWPTGTETAAPTPTESPPATGTPTATATGASTIALTPTVTQTATPLPGSTITPGGPIAVTAWVSDPAPLQGANVTVYGRITASGIGIPSVPMHTVWYYKTTTSTCDAVSGSNGIASCTRAIGRPTKGYYVRIVVEFTYGGQKYSAETGFTPQ